MIVSAAPESVPRVVRFPLINPAPSTTSDPEDRSWDLAKRVEPERVVNRINDPVSTAFVENAVPVRLNPCPALYVVLASVPQLRFPFASVSLPTQRSYDLTVSADPETVPRTS